MTLFELRSLIDGCPSNQHDGACTKGVSCFAQSCPDSECSRCSKGRGPGFRGCYAQDGIWSFSSLGACEYIWSATAVDTHGAAAHFIVELDTTYISPYAYDSNFRWALCLDG